MKVRLRRLGKYLTEKVSITITPSPRHKIRTFAFRRFVPILIILIIFGTIGTLATLYKYYEQNYFVTKSNLETLKGVRRENQRLKKELLALNQETDQLKQTLAKLKEHNREIKDMIQLGKNNRDKEEVDLTLRSMYSLNQNVLQQGLPIGGSDFNLYYYDPEELIKRMKNNINSIKNELPAQKEKLENLESSVKRYNALKAATPSIWPLADKGNGYISSEFGWRTHPTSGRQEFHEGIDIGVWYNTPVLSTAYGTVTFAGWMNGYGWVVKINHGFGFETRYAHLNKMKVKKGQKVKRGQVIGYSGNSGRSTGPHLHYEVRKNNIPQNPRKYIGG